MEFLQRVKKDLGFAMKEGVDLIKEGATTLSSKTSRIAKKSAASVRSEANRVTLIGNLRFQNFRLNREAKEKFSELGGRIYDQASKKTKDYHFDETTQKLISKIQKIEERIKKTKTEIQILSKKIKEPKEEK